jgi:hypothetical protein
MYMLTFDANDAASYPGYGFGVAATLANNGSIVAEFDVDGHEAQASMFGKTTINDGKWHLIVATYTPATSTQRPTSTGRIYIDGVLDSTSKTMAELESPTVETHLLNPVAEYIGTDDDGHSSAFQGLMCDLRFYSGAISASQIAAMYAPATRWQHSVVMPGPQKTVPDTVTPLSKTTGQPSKLSSIDLIGDMLVLAMQEPSAVKAAPGQNQNFSSYQAAADDLAWNALWSDPSFRLGALDSVYTMGRGGHVK